MSHKEVTVNKGGGGVVLNFERRNNGYWSIDISDELIATYGADVVEILTDAIGQMKAEMMPDVSIDTLADRLDSLWDGERVDWKIDHVESFWNAHPSYWIVWLNSHEEDGPDGSEATLSWRFEDDSLLTAMTEAVNWCEQLAPWKQCDECDGKGYWNGCRCEQCNATGLSA